MSAETPAPLLTAAAANLAGWHDLQLRALGCRTERNADWWWTTDDAPGLYLRAIALRPDAPLAAVTDRLHPSGWSGICDPWAILDAAPAGFLPDGDRPWMARPVAPVAPGALPDGVSITAVHDPSELVEHELAAALGFGATIPEPGAWHGPAILGDPRLGIWIARRGGEAVGTAMAFREAGVLGVYAISTLPSQRRRGIGGALTRTAVSFDPSLPAVLQASEIALPLYAAIGFRTEGIFRTWVRGPRG